MAQTGDGMNSDEYGHYLSKCITSVNIVDPIHFELEDHNICIPVRRSMYWGESRPE